jgi:hypothetical protein
MMLKKNRDNFTLISYLMLPHSFYSNISSKWLLIEIVLDIHSGLISDLKQISVRHLKGSGTYARMYHAL